MRISVAVLLLSVVGLSGCKEAPPPVEEIRVSTSGSAAEAPPVRVGETDWPWWRGPGLDGRSASADAPTSWSATENVVWEVEVPGKGHSSPVVVGDRVLLTTADEEAGTQSVLALDRNTGEPLWTRVAHTGGLMRKHDKNSHASATVACDGEHVYAAFIHDGGLHVTATDLDGAIVWQTKAGSFESEHGYGSAPVIHGPFVIVNGDNVGSSFVAALHRGTGEIAWRTGRKATGEHGSYASPAVATLAGREQLLLTGQGLVTSYDPATGEVIWTCDGPSTVTASTPVFSETHVFVSGGYPTQEILAIRADGSGDVSDSHVAWRASRGVTYVPSPLHHDGRLFVVADDGIATCFDAESGKQLWQKRIGGEVTASPVLVGDRIYSTNEDGRTTIFRAGPKYEEVAENDLGERTLATPTAVGGRIYLRTDRHLYCIGE